MTLLQCRQPAIRIAHRVDGAVLLETILAMGVMLTLLWGLMQFGQFLSQVVWLQQSMYQVAASAAETADSDFARTTRATQTWRRLLQLHNDPLFHSGDDQVWRNAPLEFDANTLGLDINLSRLGRSGDPHDRLVVVQVEGAFRPIGHMIAIPIRSSFTVSMIQFVGNNTNPGDLIHFGSPAVQYDCCGNRCGPGFPRSCPNIHCFSCKDGDANNVSDDPTSDCLFNPNSCLQ